MNLNRQSAPTNLAAAFQNLASGSGGHPLSESMFSDSF
jgi:hypothetical protein